MTIKIKPFFALLLTAVLLIYVACRKVDTASSTPDTTNPAVHEDKFFNSHRTNDPLEKSIVEFLKRANVKSNFVEKTIKQIGFPRWDKALITKKSTVGNRGNNVGDSLILIPFVRDTQNYVNASLTVELSATDTLVNWICDWQYASKTYTTDSIRNNTAEEFALFMMMLDAQVFGHKDFFISDTSLFRNLSTFTSHPQFGSENTRRIHLEPDSTSGTGNRSSAMAAPAPSYNWTMWYYYIIDYYGLNNFYNSIPDYGSGGGGGGGSTTVPPPPNCGPVAARGQVVEGCTPGWTPNPVVTPPPYNPNNAANIKIDTSISNHYPCLTDLLQTMPNINREAQLLLDSTFNVKSYVNLTFAIDPNLGVNNNPALTYPTSVQTLFSGGAALFNDTIFINPYYVNNATKEFMVGVLYHEAIHTYINYQFYRYSIGEIADSNIIKAQFPIFWNQLSNTYALTGSIFPLEHHEQMAQSYINTIKNLILPFYNPIATQILKDRVTSSLAWGGLRQTTAWGLPGKDTCQINSDLLTSSRGNQTTVYTSSSCPMIVSDITMLKLSQPCN
jgi:hypothetical protein